MKRWRRVVVRAIAVCVAVYAIACVVVASAYRPFLYPAPHRDDARVPSDAKKIETKSSDGASVIGLRFGRDDAKTTIVFFHGNGEIASSNSDLAAALVESGYAVVLAEYRGYGMSRSAGAPSERAIYADAEALLESVAGSAGSAVVLMGFSLGTGVAVEMAARGHGRALVLLAPYTSIPDVAEHHLPIFPMRVLMRDAFDSRAKAAAITIPAFVAHGDADEVVPFDMGETLAHTFPHGRFVAVPRGGHMDLFTKDDHLMRKIVEFLIDVGA